MVKKIIEIFKNNPVMIWLLLCYTFVYLALLWVDIKAQGQLRSAFRLDREESIMFSGLNKIYKLKQYSRLMDYGYYLIQSFIFIVFGSGFFYLFVKSMQNSEVRIIDFFAGIKQYCVRMLGYSSILIILGMLIVFSLKIIDFILWDVSAYYRPLKILFDNNVSNPMPRTLYLSAQPALIYLSVYPILVFLYPALYSSCNGFFTTIKAAAKKGKKEYSAFVLIGTIVCAFSLLLAGISQDTYNIGDAVYKLIIFHPMVAMVRDFFQFIVLLFAFVIYINDVHMKFKLGKMLKRLKRY